MRSHWRCLAHLSFEKGRGWERSDFAVMARLHERGHIINPHGKQKSIHLTDEGLALEKAGCKAFVEWAANARRPFCGPF